MKIYNSQSLKFYNLALYGSEWVDHLLDLLYRHSDRSVLHIRQMLRSETLCEPRVEWLPPRLPKYGEALAARGERINSSRDELRQDDLQ